MNFSTCFPYCGAHGILRAMGICLCKQSSLSFWRHFDNRLPSMPVFGHTPGAGPLLPQAFPARGLLPVRGFDAFSLDLRLLSSCDFSCWGIGRDDSVHVLLPRRARNLEAPRAVVHSMASLPKSAVLKVDDGMYVTSPECTFVQMACENLFIDQVLLGYELCGCYSVRPDLAGGMMQRHPLCSPESIAQFMEKAGPIRGRDLARRALRYVRAGSGSPMEAKLLALWCLPMKYGGYGLPFPEVNKHIDLGKHGSLLWRGKNAFDLVWEDVKLVVEYDGVVHDSAGSRERDSLRRDALVAAGYAPIVVTKERFETIGATYALTKVVAKALGVQLRFRSDDFGRKHRELWWNLFGTERNASYFDL